MTIKQAINELKDWQTAFSHMDKDMSYAIEAFGMAIKALEKQVPKNPVGATDRNEMWIEGALLCPDCNTYFGEVFDEGYCRKCGRKLIQKRVRVIEAG